MCRTFDSVLVCIVAWPSQDTLMMNSAYEDTIGLIEHGWFDGRVEDTTFGDLWRVSLQKGVKCASHCPICEARLTITY